MAAAYDPDTAAAPGYYRLLPHVTHAPFPRAIRIPPGAIETITRKGDCDSAARAAAFLLGRLGYPAVQVNFVHPIGHSALLVTLPSGHTVFVDPFFGVAAHDGARLVSLERLIAALAAGQPPAAHLLALRDDPRHHFYQAIAGTDVAYAPQGEDPKLAGRLPPTGGQEIVIGMPDGRTETLQRALVEHGLSAFFHYVGARYDNTWTRTLRTSEDIVLELVLTEAVDEELIVSSHPARIAGNTVSWTLDADEALVLFDNRAPSRYPGRPYQDIGYIRIVPASDQGEAEPSTAPDSGVAAPAR